MLLLWTVQLFDSRSLCWQGEEGRWSVQIPTKSLQHICRWTGRLHTSSESSWNHTQGKSSLSSGRWGRWGGWTKIGHWRCNKTSQTFAQPSFQISAPLSVPAWFIFSSWCLEFSVSGPIVAFSSISYQLPTFSSIRVRLYTAPWSNYEEKEAEKAVELLLIF